MVLRDIAVRDAIPGSPMSGIIATEDAHIEVEDFEVVRSTITGLTARCGGQLAARRGVVAETRSGRLFEVPVSPILHSCAAEGGVLSLRDVELGHGEGIGILAQGWLGPQPTVDLIDVTIAELQPEPATRTPMGIHATGAEVRAERLEIRAVGGPGLAVSPLPGVQTTTDVRCTECTIQDVQLPGVLAVGADEAPTFSACPDLEQPVQTIDTAPVDRAPIEL